MVHHGLDTEDAALRRYLAGAGCNKNIEHIGQMSQVDRDKSWRWLSALPTEGIVNLVSHYEQKSLVTAMGGEPEEADPFATTP